MAGTATGEQRGQQRDFLNRYYGISRHFYDLTRKYYLFGRDRAIDVLLDDPWETLIEIGVGTGRNLRKLRRKRPEARYGGIDASDEMLIHARRKCSWASMEHGFAEDADLRAPLGTAPDRILFSYCLSMVNDPLKALENARRSLSPSGQVIVVDFCDFRGLPGPFGRGMRRWLDTFHVHALPMAEIEPQAFAIEFGYGRYWFLGRFAYLPTPEGEGSGSTDVSPNGDDSPSGTVAGA